jgi:hypothetical protein
MPKGVYRRNELHLAICRKGANVIGEMMKGNLKSIETRKRMSEGQKKRYLLKPVSVEQRKRMSDAHKGEKHTEEYKQKMSLVKAKEIVAGVARKSEFHYKNMLFRSAGEVSVAKWLDSNGVHWQYEPEAFLLPNGRHYVPDFKLGNEEYLEVKNRFSLRSESKMNQFKQMGNILNVIDANDMKMRLW